MLKGSVKILLGILLFFVRIITVIDISAYDYMNYHKAINNGYISKGFFTLKYYVENPQGFEPVTVYEYSYIPYIIGLTLILWGLYELYKGVKK